MNKEALIVSAQSLVASSPDAARAYGALSAVLAARLNEIMLARADLRVLVGHDGESMMRDNHRNHTLYIVSILSFYAPVSFVETVLWVFRTCRAHGFSVAYWPAMLDESLRLLSEALPKDVFEQVAPFYRWLLIHIPDFTVLSETHPSAWDPQKSCGHEVKG